MKYSSENMDYATTGSGNAPEPTPIGLHWNLCDDMELNTTLYTINALVPKSHFFHHSSETELVPKIIKVEAGRFPLECRCSHIMYPSTDKECKDTSCYTIGKGGPEKCGNKYCKGHKVKDGRCFGKFGLVLAQDAQAKHT